MGCNLRRESIYDIHCEVSVPSTGRSGLQLGPSQGIAVYHELFQYPLRVEVGCNQHGKRCGDNPRKFQYPLRVEVGCNEDSESNADRR